jgi:hypothetical protein
MSHKLTLSTIYGVKSNQGLVVLTVDGTEIQMDLDKAREIRQMWHDVIEAAVSDELLVKFLTSKIGLSLPAAAAALQDFRELRQGTRETVFPS